MSNAVSALNGKTYQGSVKITELGLQGMITLRGEWSATAIQKAAVGVTGVKFPDVGQCNRTDLQGIAWMSPDEVLVMVPYEKVDTAIEDIKKTLGTAHALVANVSDARAVIQLEGSQVRDVLSKLVPVDMDPKSFEVGRIRRTRLAQIAAAFWLSDEETLTVVCFRSVADYAFDVLSRAAMPGTDVGFHS